MIAEYATSQWLRNLRAEAQVQVRVNGKRFSARARVVEPQSEPALHRSVQELSRQKYGWGDGTVVELSASE